jgi:hypothetical protein
MNVCRECGCTDARACPGGCFWVLDDLCSACALSAMAQKVHALEPEAQEWLLERVSQIAEDLVHHLDAADGVTRIARIARIAGVAHMDYAGHELPRLWQPGDPI